jgi:hypothetical protein
LALGDEQNALVFMRKAQLAQTFLEQQHYKEIVEANQAAQNQTFKISKDNYPTQYAQMMDASSAIKSSFMNPFSDYLASLLYAATGDVNNSVVSLKNALQVAPNNVYLQNALLLGLQAQGGDGMLSEYLKAYGKTAPPVLPDNAGTLAIIYEQGLVPAMQEVQVPIPVPGGMVTVSFPYYDSKTFPAITPMSVSENGKTLGQTELLTNNALLAEKALVENYPLIILRMVLRFGAQATAMVAADQNNNGAANLGIMFYSILFSNADLRSWLTLPDNVQIFEAPLQAQDYTLALNGDNVSSKAEVSIKPHSITLLWVTQLGSHLQVKTFNLN